jgi:ribonuclease P protein component
MPTRTHTFPRKIRLSGRLTFAAVFDAKTKASRGALTLYTKPNALPHCRWGLSVPRRVGTAVRRNRAKRLLRESIRHIQHDVAAGYDIIIVVRPHELLTLPEYHDALTQMLAKTHAQWAKIR